MAAAFKCCGRDEIQNILKRYRQMHWYAPEKLFVEKMTLLRRRLEIPRNVHHNNGSGFLLGLFIFSIGT